MLPLRDLHSQLDEALNINDIDSVFSDLYYTDLINELVDQSIRNKLYAMLSEDEISFKVIREFRNKFFNK